MTEQGRKIINMVLSLLVAIGAWTFVVYNYDPMTYVTYSGVPVRYSGLVTLANRGYAVSGTNHETVEVKLQQRRIQTGTIDAGDITVTADVSGLSNGENTVSLNVSGPEGTSVNDISAKSVVVTIESAGSEELPVSVEYSRQPEENTEPIVDEMSSETATVIATAEVLDKIDHIAAIVDPDELSDRLRPMTVQLAALDAEGGQVLNVMIDPETLSFKAANGFTKEVALTVNVADDSDDSYERTYTAPETVMIKGSEEAIKNIETVQSKEIDISYIYEDTEIPIELELPDGIYLARGNSDILLKLKVTEKKQSKSSEENDE